MDKKRSLASKLQDVGTWAQLIVGIFCVLMVIWMMIDGVSAGQAMDKITEFANSLPSLSFSATVHTDTFGNMQYEFGHDFRLPSFSVGQVEGVVGILKISIPFVVISLIVIAISIVISYASPLIATLVSSVYALIGFVVITEATTTLNTIVANGESLWIPALIAIGLFAATYLPLSFMGLLAKNYFWTKGEGNRWALSREVSEHMQNVKNGDFRKEVTKTPEAAKFFVGLGYACKASFKSAIIPTLIASIVGYALTIVFSSALVLYVVFGVGLFITFGQLIAFNRMYESEKFWKNLSNQKSK